MPVEVLEIIRNKIFCEEGLLLAAKRASSVFEGVTDWKKVPVQEEDDDSDLEGGDEPWKGPAQVIMYTPTVKKSIVSPPRLITATPLTPYNT